MDDLTFRPYSPDDLDACAQIAADAWPTASTLAAEGDFLRLMHGYVELGRLPSTRPEVACLSDRVVGFLFARIDSEVSATHYLRVLLSCAAIGTRGLLGRYGRISQPIGLLRDGIATGARVRRHMPEADAIVELFVVSAEHRGQGIGKALMDRLVDVARDRGVRRIALHSDELSSWGFYEKYGFQRVATFDEVISSRLTGESKKGFIYVMDLERPSREAS